MESNFVAELVKLGPVAGLLGAAVWYFYRRDVRNEERNDARHKDAETRCDGERKTLTEKVERLEDRIAEMNENTLSRATEALEQNVRAFERFCDRVEVTPPHGRRSQGDA